MTSAAAPAIALTIAGSEATGGAGAQADLKTFQELGVFGIVNLTCIVSFDPKDNWNHRFVPVDQQVIADQLEATTAAYGVASGAPSVLDTVKIGMLGSPATISTVEKALSEGAFSNIVLDPVLICKGQEPGHALDTDQALKAQILPLATFVTPNHFEAESLSGLTITDEESLKAAAIRIHELSGAAVLAKGGVRLEGADAVDVFYDGRTLEVLRAAKVGEVAVSGAGCSLAAAVTAELAKGASPLEAARTAKAFVTDGIRNRVASGAPFDALWQGGALS
ncbi:hydroxymethylpyrimidine/phosphomethylpyrimidine kinase [Paenarthrobacter ureafaciens]|uniref:hydroxymethylpyrimidine/phosphomethylpyrimidine kinase n=1 Tax=Paenarthrobacter ureafaciens TaxID=37931 RepID=UPI00196AD4EE|nr:hydroxymethylpyrimidine/phosphomethylpyrimidine kinase [Paenarthrobacter ureafaciens]MCX8454734.1 hydroxymethylpyrimidine/phosphomethylpyrimidine kinase [Paenarthrobacter ureafaciens]MCY0973540.1 hydroxymethylpyrimidine/phosphomethylpyrimidine kinase [Paenarthrobacter ureafaciens]